MIDLTKYEGHTKGPWTDNEDEQGDIVSASSTFYDQPIIECDSGTYGPYGADRALIIDAPLILDELKKAYDRIEFLECELESKA